MQLETYLNAMANARASYFLEPLRVNANKRQRQYRAFRNRILRMFDFENNAQKIAIEAYKAVIKQQQQRIEELEKVLDVEYVPKLKKRIAELELQAQQMDDAYKSLQDMLFKAEQRIAELEAELDKLYKEKSNRGAAIENM